MNILFEAIFLSISINESCRSLVGSTAVVAWRGLRLFEYIFAQTA